MSGRGRRLRDLAVLLLSGALSFGLGLVLLAAYVGVRAPCVARGRPNIELQEFVRDAELGWLPPPLLRWRVRARPDGPASLFLATNRQGLRGEEPDPSASGGVMMLGDSFVQGYFLSERETIPAALSRRISAGVHNLGVGGYSTDQEYTLLQRVLRRHRARHVVVMFFINDLLYLRSGHGLRRGQAGLRGARRPRGFRLAATRAAGAPRDPGASRSGTSRSSSSARSETSRRRRGPTPSYS